MTLRRKRQLVALTALGALVALPTALLAVTFRIDIQPEAGSITQPSSGKVMNVYESTAASGGRFIGTDDVLENGTQKDRKWSKAGEGGSVKCSFQVDNAGDYALWVRAKWAPGTCGDSVFLQLDNNTATIFGEQGTKDAWTWWKVEDPYNLSKGKHTITISPREDGAKIDKLIFTTSTRTPTGKDG